MIFSDCLKAIAGFIIADKGPFPKVQFQRLDNLPDKGLNSRSKTTPRLLLQGAYRYNESMKTITLLLTVLFAFPSFADYESYDEIVDKLSNYETTELSKNPAYRGELRSFSRAHIGLGLAQTFFDADATALDSNMQNQGGLAINIGVDVLSHKWGIEGSYSNFGTNNVDATQIKLREFSLKGLYKPTLSKNWSMRVGMGFSSRFLNINNPATSEEYKTPSAVFVMGLDSYINSFVSIGADFSFKTAMIDDTIDKNSADVSFRVDTHF